MNDNDNDDISYDGDYSDDIDVLKDDDNDDDNNEYDYTDNE